MNDSPLWQALSGVAHRAHQGAARRGLCNAPPAPLTRPQTPCQQKLFDPCQPNESRSKKKNRSPSRSTRASPTTSSAAPCRCSGRRGASPSSWRPSERLAGSRRGGWGGGRGCEGIEGRWERERGAAERCAPPPAAHARGLLPQNHAANTHTPTPNPHNPTQSTNNHKQQQPPPPATAGTSSRPAASGRSARPPTAPTRCSTTRCRPTSTRAC